MEFEAIYREYWSKVFRLCMGYVNDYGLAQDMARETFVAVWQKLSSFRNEAAVGTWIFRIAAIAVFVSWNGRAAWFRLLSRPTCPKKKGRVSVCGFVCCINSLPNFRRWTASSFHSNWKMSRQAEIARITGLSEGNVRVRIHRIKALLTKKIRAYEE